MIQKSDTGNDCELLFSVVICTRNRASSLQRTLNSIVEAAANVASDDAPGWEVLVVDNGSTDDTQETVARFEDRLPIRSVVQPIAGLSNARNAGIDAAQGRFLLWTVDDVLVDQAWLSSYQRAFLSQPETGIFGGRAVPQYEEPAVSWFVDNQRHLSSLLAIRDAPEWTEIKPGQLPFGLNFAVRRDIQVQHRFNPDLGVAPGRRIGGEESSMLRAALASGATGRWVWDATVYHLIPAARQSLNYVYDYYSAQGFLYPKPDIIRSDGTHKLADRFAIWLKVRSKFLSANLYRILGRKSWVRKYADYARWAGTLDRFRQGDKAVKPFS